MFELIYLILYFVGTETWFQLAREQTQRQIPYHFGIIIYSMIFHFIVFVTSIRMFGFWIGLLIGLLEMLTFSHALVSWIFSLPSVIKISKNFSRYKNLGYLPDSAFETPPSILRFRTALLALIVYGGAFHMILSFIIYDYKGALDSYLWTDTALYVMLSVILLLGFAKFIIYRQTSTV